MKIFKLVLPFVALIPAACFSKNNSYSYFDDAAKIVEHIRTGQTGGKIGYVSRAYVAGYLTGVIDVNNHNDFCVAQSFVDDRRVAGFFSPDNTGFIFASSLVIKHAETYPSALSGSATSMITEVLKANSPCTKESTTDRESTIYGAKWLGKHIYAINIANSNPRVLESSQDVTFVSDYAVARGYITAVYDSLQMRGLCKKTSSSMNYASLAQLYANHYKNSKFNTGQTAIDWAIAPLSKEFDCKIERKFKKT